MRDAFDRDASAIDNSFEQDVDGEIPTGLKISNLLKTVRSTFVVLWKKTPPICFPQILTWFIYGKMDMTNGQSLASRHMKRNGSLRSRGRGRGRGLGGGEVFGEFGKKKERGVGEGAPSITDPIGSILRSLATAKFRLVTQTIGGVGRHEHALADLNVVVTREFTLKPEQEVAVRGLPDGKDVLAVLPTIYGKSLIYQMFVHAKDYQMNDKGTTSPRLLFDFVSMSLISQKLDRMSVSCSMTEDENVSISQIDSVF